MEQAKRSRRLWIGAALTLGVAMLGALVALGPGSDPAAGSRELGAAPERTAEQGWLAAHGEMQRVEGGIAGTAASERTLRTGVQRTGIVIAPDGSLVPGATLVLFTLVLAPPAGSMPGGFEAAPANAENAGQVRHVPLRNDLERFLIDLQ